MCTIFYLKIGYTLLYIKHLVCKDFLRIEKFTLNTKLFFPTGKIFFAYWVGIATQLEKFY